jgi:anhydro-N-acetylmuramic acid kinase
MDLESPFAGRFIGVMSGTSLDAIDLVVADLSLFKTKENKQNNPLFCLAETNLQHYEHPYPKELKKLILSLQTNQLVSLAHLVYLEKKLTLLYAEAVKNALKHWKLHKSSVLAVCNHGQTVFHQRDEAGEMGTLQLGDASLLAETLGMRVIADFRRGDIGVGGQGAPLLPFYDALRFSEVDKTVVAHNLGGISNVSVLPAQSLGVEPFAFDTGLANLWIDRTVLEYFGQAYDQNGIIAQSALPIEPFVTAILEHPFHQAPPPKSTGRDDFSDDYLFSLVAKYSKNASKEALVASITHATALSMVRAYKDFIIPKVGKVDTLIFSGGGIYNRYLIDLFLSYWQSEGLLGSPEIKHPEDFGIPNKGKEALGFAWLGWAKWHGLPNNLPSCTGANAYVSGGVIY